jgi:hypothetical protein
MAANISPDQQVPPQTKTAPQAPFLFPGGLLSLSRTAPLCATPASAVPTIGASQNSQSCCNATQPTNNAGPVERAGLTDVLVTGIEIRWISGHSYFANGLAHAADETLCHAGTQRLTPSRCT